MTTPEQKRLDDLWRMTASPAEEEARTAASLFVKALRDRGFTIERLLAPGKDTRAQKRSDESKIVTTLRFQLQNANRTIESLRKMYARVEHEREQARARIVGLEQRLAELTAALHARDRLAALNAVAHAPNPESSDPADWIDMSDVARSPIPPGPARALGRERPIAAVRSTKVIVPIHRAIFPVGSEDDDD